MNTINPKKLIKSLLAIQIISGSVVIVGGGLASNFLNFLFNLFMTRNLSVSDYGILASLVSVITLFSIPAAAITPTVVRFGATYFANNELDKVRGLFYKIFVLSAGIGILVFVSFIVFHKVIGDFFNINQTSLIMLAGLTIAIVYIGTVNNSLLQAKLKFMFIAIMNTVSSATKLLLGAGLVFLGFKVGGALWGFFISYLVPYVMSFFPLSFLMSKSIKSPPISDIELVKYGAPSAIALFAVSSFITTDIILIKHFWSAEQAGLYSGLSLIGRVIYFLTAPVAMVMFPLIVQKHAKNEEYGHIFKLALLMVGLPSIAITIFYFLFGHFTINFFAKNDYLSVSQYLGLFGIFTTIFSLVSVITNYFLSIKRTEIAWGVVVGATAQAVGIWMVHNTFLQVILISIASVSGVFIFEIIYYIKTHGKKP